MFVYACVCVSARLCLRCPCARVLCVEQVAEAKKPQGDSSLLLRSWKGFLLPPYPSWEDEDKAPG